MKKIQKQLMYGDLVLVKPSMMPIRICAIHKNKVGYHSHINTLEWAWMNILVPIPLTEEFFEKNGFKKETDIVGDEWVSKDRRLIVRKDCSNMVGRDWHIHIYNEDMQSIGSGCIQFVHQFQNKLNDAEIEMEVVL